MTSIEEEIKDLKRRIAKFEEEYDNATSEDKRTLRPLLTEKERQLTVLLQQQLQQQQQQQAQAGGRQGKTLEKFQFVTYSNLDFPDHDGGKVIFRREKLIKDTATLVLEKFDDRFRTYYWRAPIGSGKTVFSMLMGRELQSRGCDVYSTFGTHLDDFDKGYFALLARQAGNKTVVLLIDEVKQSSENSGHWVDLLKARRPPNLLVLGFGPARLGNSPQFDEKFPEEGQDFPMFFNFNDLPELSAHFCRSGLNLEHVTEVCKYILTLTAGHPFPFVKFVEHLINCHVELENLETYISSQEFRDTVVYKSVRNRCFTELLDGQHIKKAKNLLMNEPESGDFEDLDKVGLWRDNYFISPLVACEVFQQLKIRASTDLLVLDDSQTTPYAQQVISAGLRDMTEENFREAQYDEVAVENAIGFHWAFNVKELLPNVWLAPQARTMYEEHEGPGRKPVIDFFFNGRLNMGIEIVLNAKIKSLEEHFERFENKYKRHKKNGVLFHVDTKNGFPCVLGKWEGKRPVVYTFLKKTNELYCHSHLVQSNVSRNLPSPPARLYSTLVVGCLRSILKRLK